MPNLNSTAFVLLAVILCTAGAAADDCIEGVVSLGAWSAARVGSETKVRIGLLNEGNDNIAMIKGDLHFTDPFGDALLPPLILSPDATIVAGSAAGHVSSYSFDRSARLATVDKALVTTRLCITGIVFGDGTTRTIDN